MQFVSDFSKCCKENGFKMTFKCRDENRALWNCVEKWFFDEEFKEKCTQEYLKERSEYRRTGIPTKQREKH